MAAMVYESQGESDAKTLLFQCIGEENPLPQALFSACALALLHSDNELAKLTVDELRKIENDPLNGRHAIFLITQFLTKQNKLKEAIVYVQQRIHDYPDRPNVRKILADILLPLSTQKKFVEPASRMAESVVELSLQDFSVTSLELAEYLAYAAKAMKKRNKPKCKLLAQKAIYLDPTCRDAWDMLELFRGTTEIKMEIKH